MTNIMYIHLDSNSFMHPSLKNEWQGTFFFKKLKYLKHKFHKNIFMGKCSTSEIEHV